MSARYGKKKPSKEKAKKPPQHVPLGPAPSNAPRGTVLVKLTLNPGQWNGLNATARRALRVPLGWTKVKGVERPARLRWPDVGGSRVAWVVDGSGPADELAAVLLAAGVGAAREALKHQLRRVPMGAIMTDPSGNGVRTEVELHGFPLLARDRRGRWRLYSINSAATWPQAAAPILGDHVAGTEGYTSPTPWASARYAVEEGTLVPATGRKLGTRLVWQRRTTFVSLAEACGEMERAATADARVGRSARWRAVDVGTGAMRAETRRGKKGLKRVDYAPGPKSERGTTTVVAVPTGAP